MTRRATRLFLLPLLAVCLASGRSSGQTVPLPSVVPEGTPTESATPLPLVPPAPTPPGPMPIPPSPPAPIPAPRPAGSIDEGWTDPVLIPRSLFAPAPEKSQYACRQLPGPYFELDPELDPPQFPQPGWFAGVEAQAVAPHIFNTLANGSPVGNLPVDSVRLPVGGFNWTVAPRAEIGYRLMSGFGEFSIGYRGFGTTGNSTTIAPDGLGALNNHIDLNQIDVDYASRMFTPWEHWGMRWRIGVRTAFLYYDTQVSQSYPAAAAGSGLLQQRDFNDFKGVGPHVGLELDRDLYFPGLSMMIKGDFASMLGRVKQGSSVESTITGFNESNIDNSQTVPVLSGQLGLNYSPPGLPITIFAGGLYEYWWNVGRLSNFSVYSRGEMSLTGLTLRLQYNF